MLHILVWKNNGLGFEPRFKDFSQRPCHKFNKYVLLNAKPMLQLSALMWFHQLLTMLLMVPDDSLQHSSILLNSFFLLYESNVVITSDGALFIKSMPKRFYSWSFEGGSAGFVSINKIFMIRSQRPTSEAIGLWVCCFLGVVSGEGLFVRKPPLGQQSS